MSEYKKVLTPVEGISLLHYPPKVLFYRNKELIFIYCIIFLKCRKSFIKEERYEVGCYPSPKSRFPVWTLSAREEMKKRILLPSKD